jgi:hypothetical protein
LLNGRYSLGKSPPASATIVNPTRLVAGDDPILEDLPFLAGAAAYGATLTGSLNLQTPYDEARHSSPLAGVPIRVASSTMATEVTTNADGTFVVTGVGPGDVELEPLLPDGMTLVFSSVRRTIGDGGCVDCPLRAAFNGRGRGMVRAANGTALPWVALELVPVDDKQARTAESDSHTRASANRDGQFEFSAISPGTYWLGVNLGHGLRAARPIPPRTFLERQIAMTLYRSSSARALSMTRSISS